MDIPFRIALLAMFLASMTIGVYHRLQARKTNECFDRRQEGTLLAIALRVFGIGLWAATLVYLLRPTALHWAALSLPNWLRWLGIVPAALGIALMYWTLVNLGKNLTDTVAMRRDATLVTRGPYRWVRHPFYVTAALLMLAATLLAANWLIAACGLAVIALLVARTPKEEQKLIEKFGDDYRRYMAHTGRFIPRVPRG